MSQKGSRLNPYSSSEYSTICTTSEWRGGWVEYGTTSSSLKYYITNTGERIPEKLGGMLGSEERPFAYSYFNEMSNLDIWTGGWVLPNPISPSPRGTTYHTANNEIYGEINLIPLGEEENPFLARVYNEMVVNEIWLGGWVLYDAGNKEYVESMYGSGSGSGCGCASGAGCGCGSGFGGGSYLNAGSERYRPDGVGTDFELLISWGSGSFDGGQTPALSVLLINNLEDPYTGTPVSAEWDGTYRVKIISADVPTIFYTIPGHYWA